MHKTRSIELCDRCQIQMLEKKMTIWLKLKHVHLWVRLFGWFTLVWYLPTWERPDYTGIMFCASEHFPPGRNGFLWRAGSSGTPSRLDHGRPAWGLFPRHRENYPDKHYPVIQQRGFFDPQATYYAPHRTSNSMEGHFRCLIHSKQTTDLGQDRPLVKYSMGIYATYWLCGTQAS